MKIAIILLAAGASSRMGGADKLAREIHGEALLHRSASEAVKSGASVVVVTSPERGPLVADLPVTVVAGGSDMSASLRAGLGSIDATAVIVALADMPDVTAAHYTALMAAYDPDTRPICRAVTADGTAGHPVLFDQQFFDALGNITGDQGARQVLQQNAAHVTLVATVGDGARIDLDTESDWDEYRK